MPYDENGRLAVLELHPAWAHVDPFALSIIAAWGGWCKRNNIALEVENLGRHANYLARMRLFQHLSIDYTPSVVEHEETGRFLPLTQVQNYQQLTSVIADISALLHLDTEPDALAAVQYCVSELIRNVLEHSGSPEGAFVCAHRYISKDPKRVTIAVADCGRGIASHLGSIYPEALESDKIALGLAMRPGITGAKVGLYGTPENAGAGLFITRSIAKGTGGYFLLQSGETAYRLRRTNSPHEQIRLYFEAFDEPRYDLWSFPSKWLGTTVTVEIRTDRIEDFQGFFQWIRQQMPARKTISKKIRFT
ncbi:MAG: ATP-binding protein [Blastocatellia bacterium]|nr:ATP-binding protein [Blastocatellia bacterium]